MSDIVLTIEQAVVSHGEVVAVDDVSLQVRQGEAVALLGANGAGKSTLLNALVGHSPLQAGSIRFFGRPIENLAPWQRARLGIGYSPEGRRIFPAMTVRENLEIAGGKSAGERAARIDEVFHVFPALRHDQASPGWRLSGGQQQMLAIGRALMRGTRLIVLDEPSLGLSPILVQEVFRRLGELVAAGGAVLLADQNVSAALPAVNRAYVMRNGRIVAQGQADELARSDILASALFG
jgi:branched-chain amino acid transport system ATP-binding protein